MREPKEIPMLFSGPMVQALLNDNGMYGPKVMTRRATKLQSIGDLGWITDWGWTFFTPDNHISGRGNHPVDGPSETHLPCPYQIGDTIWVKETWTKWDGGIAYLANSLDKYGKEDSDSKRCRLDYGVTWKPSIFMPKEICRIRLEITNVFPQAITHISEQDILREGVTVEKVAKWTNTPWGSIPTLHDAWRLWWNHLNEARGYPYCDSTWVWAISFKRLASA